EISSEIIGKLVMEGLERIDTVAYVRFASVYKNFREAADFGAFVGEMEGPGNKDK
ncbi:MAG: transcriptional regulator NrdR, partial [Proteobacteria bacterium]|nr:transcriptional regulator NrdR [Pseudomonadota bacterium]